MKTIIRDKQIQIGLKILEEATLNGIELPKVVVEKLIESGAWELYYKYCSKEDLHFKQFKYKRLNEVFTYAD